MNRPRSKRGRRRKKLVGRAFLLFLACIILAVGGCAMYRRARDWSIFSIRTIVVRGVKEDLIPGVIEASGVEKGRNILKLDLSETARRLRLLDFVEDVRISRRPIGRLVLDILERKPFVIVNGRMVVGEDGKEVHQGKTGIDLPELACQVRKHEDGSSSVDPELLERGMLVLAKAEGIGIERVDLINRDDVRLILKNGAVVHLGTCRFADKLKMVSLVLEHLGQEKTRFSQIDARFSCQVFVKK